MTYKIYLFQQIDDIRSEYNDKENIVLLDKGVKALFRRTYPNEFLSPTCRPYFKTIMAIWYDRRCKR